MKKELSKHHKFIKKKKTYLFIGVFLFCYLFTIKICSKMDLKITNEVFLKYLIDSLSAAHAFS